ncbi:putative signal transducing protein [Brevundimonas sp.]|uniref:putative signal transducing protein n=1 Tax=Brevundimonas sp. TaxID=1871086 RepID=UPI002D6048D5|nr:DUF2007 domain-containing protein [Brevundimonas sp.]HYD28591.1 DUF2007 domain-containing protein [Brevundimonas sp.]
MIEIARFADVYEAEIVASRLRAEGYDAVLGGAEHAKVNFLVLQALGGVNLSVPDNQAGAARALLEALRGGAERIENADPVLPKAARKAGLVAVLTLIGLGFLVGR